MSGIPEGTIEEIRDRADIVEVIGEIVQLRKRGRNWVGLCPFHPEKTPSFNVTPDKQMYYCFGCQAGGNVFTFLMEHEKLEFPAAVRELAERTGVEIPERRTAGPDPDEPLYYANRLAAEFYHRRLLEADDADEARSYLADRGLDRATWEAFLLGWAPDSWEALLGEAARHDLEPDVLLKAGLAARSEKTGGVYDRFRGRLCFPIRSTSGRVVALSGRRLDDREPKYLNSPDTPIFTKGRGLYNLDQAKGPIRRVGAALLVEGNFDVVALWQAGFRNVVAPLGTAFTDRQARVLKRYTTTAYLAYDGDRAGERSAFKAGDVLLSVGFAVRIVRLPSGDDPDSLVREGGAAAFEERIEASLDVVDAKLEVVRERVDLGDVMKKRRAIARLLDSVARVPDPVTRSLYVEKIAAELDVPRETLDLPDPKPARAPASRAQRAAPVAERGPRGRFAAPGVRLPESQDERYLLLHAVTTPEWLDELVERCRPEYFEVEEYAEFFRRLVALLGEGGEDAVEGLRTSDDPVVQRVLARIEMLRGGEPEGFELSSRTFRECLERVLDGALERGLIETGGEPSGDVLVDTLRRRDLRRRLAPGRFGGRKAAGETEDGQLGGGS